MFFVDLALLFDRLRIEKRIDVRPNPDDFVGVGFDHAGERPRRATKVKRLLGVIKPLDLLVPKILRPRRQLITKLVRVDRFDARQTAVTKHLEEVIKFKILDG